MPGTDARHSSDRTWEHGERVVDVDRGGTPGTLVRGDRGEGRASDVESACGDTLGSSPDEATASVDGESGSCAPDVPTSVVPAAYAKAALYGDAAGAEGASHTGGTPPIMPPLPPPPPLLVCASSEGAGGGRGGGK